MTDKNNDSISVEEALAILDEDERWALPLIVRANRVRERFFANKILTCSILNAKSGNCREDCKFCPQSVHSSSVIEEYTLLKEKDILKAAATAEQTGAHTFGIVSSGRTMAAQAEQDQVCNAVNKIATDTGIGPCASLGVADEKFLQKLKNAGLVSYHHNLEAAESFYPEICTTRSFQDNLKTVAAAKKVGLKVCCGCLFGLGENNQQRVELLESIRQLDVDSVPLNFLNPRDGTPIKDKNLRPLRPLECLKIIAVARLMMPNKTIRVCGGREYNLRDMQSWIFAAGANAIMIGAYLTTSGRNIADDLQMLRDAGMELA